MSETPPAHNRVWIGLALVLVLVAVAAFFPIEESNDAWWHLKAGKLIFDGDLGWWTPDLFTESAKEKVWVNHEWLGEVLFYGTYLLGGLRAAILFKVAILLGTFLLVFFSCRRATGGDQSALFASTLATCLAVVSSQFTFYLRPPIFTFFILALYHQLLLRERGKAPGWKPSVFMGAIMVLWANLHGGAILGCVILFLMGVGSILDWIAKRGGDEVEAIKGWLFRGAPIACASLVNPYGIHLHLLTFEMMSHKWLTQQIPEMAPPPFDLIWTLPLLLIPAAVGVFRKGSWGERLVFLFLVWQGLSHVRHLPLVSIWAAPYAAYAIAQAGELNRKTILAALLLPIAMGLNVISGSEFVPLGFLRDYRAWIVLLFVGVGLSTILLRNRRTSTAFLFASVVAIGFVLCYPGQRPNRFLRAMSGETWSGDHYADRIADFIVEHELGGDESVLLCRENHAGYFIWKLVPERTRVFTCSRFDLQGTIPRFELEKMLWLMDEATPLNEEGDMLPGWDELWKKYDFDLVLLEKYSDREDGVPFPLWTRLNDPASGYVGVAREAYPGNGRFADEHFTLFMREGAELERLMKKIGRPARLEEVSGIEG